MQFVSSDAYADRFWSKVEFGDCWLWGGSHTRNGYGQATGRDWRKKVLPHRVAYELLVGPIPEGMQLDHLCRTLLCVNPDHLEIVTHYENHQRGYKAKKTHCRRGHPLATRKRGSLVRRDCKECDRLRHRKWPDDAVRVI